MTAYLRRFAIAFVCLLILAALANLLVDPYRLWTPPLAWDASKPRPRAVQHDELLKLRGIARIAPTTVILGNSRAEIGFDPASSAWPARARPVYNAAVPGSGVARAGNMLAAAIASGHLRHAIIGVDFLDFLVDESAGEPPAAPIGRSRYGWTSDLPLLLSLDTLSDSVVTLLANGDADSADVTGDGFNPLHEYRRYARQEGYASIFMQKDAANARNYVKQPKSVFAGASRSSNAWRALDEIVRMSHAGGVDARFVIYPYHARILEMFYRAGLADAFKTWKRELATRLSASQQSCRLWDFSGYSDFSTEKVPEPGDKRTTTRWYWESGHFKSGLGDIVLAEMYDQGSSAFGRCLTAVNVDGANADLDREHAAFVERNPRAVMEISRLFATTSP